MPMTELETLLVTVEADLRRYSKQMQQLGQMTEGGFKKAGKAANDGLSAVEERSRRAAAEAQRAMQDAQRASRQFGTQLQNVGYQVGDFFVQLEGGQGVLRALTQQGSQVLGAFGPWGAVLGAAAGAAGALAGVLLGYSDDAKKAEAATDAFAAAQKALGGALDDTQKKVSDAKSALSLLELGYSGLAKLSLTDAIEKSNAAIAQTFSDIKEAGDFDWLITALGQYEAAARRGGKTFAEQFGPELDQFRQTLAALKDTTSPTLQQMETFVNQLTALQGKVPGAEGAIKGLLGAVTPLTEQMRTQADRQRILNELLAAFDKNGGKAADALSVLGKGFVQLTADTNGFVTAANGALGALKSLSNAKPDFAIPQSMSFTGKPTTSGSGMFGKTFGSLDPAALLDEKPWVDSDAINDAINPVKVLGLGFAKVVPEAKEFTDSLKAAEAAAVDLSKLPKTFTIGGGGLNFGGLPSRTDVLGQQFGTESPADLTMSEFSRSIYGKGRSTEPKPKPEKKTPEDRAEDRTQALKDEIAYNEQLAAVYGQGIEARNRVTASYEALKEARKTGLAEGSAEFKQFIDTQTAQNVVNLGLEHRLDLMKQGQALTESLMTDQERQNKLLADYKAMLDAGAIGTEIYQRAVAKATSENENLIEAIGGVGDAIESGIQGANGFSDALAKIGLQLLSLLSKGIFGAGPLGGLFNNLFNVAAGGILGTPAASINAPAAAGLSAGLGTGFRRSFAAGGMAGPGPVLVGEQGPEIANMAQRAYISPANATRRLLQGGSNDNRPIQVNVIGATGNAEVRQMVALGVDQAVKRSGRNVPGIQRDYNLRFGP